MLVLACDGVVVISVIGGVMGAIVPMVVVDVPPPNAFSSVGDRRPGVMLVLVVNARV